MSPVLEDFLHELQASQSEQAACLERLSLAGPTLQASDSEPELRRNALALLTDALPLPDIRLHVLPVEDAVGTQAQPADAKVPGATGPWSEAHRYAQCSVLEGDCACRREGPLVVPCRGASGETLAFIELSVPSDHPLPLHAHRVALVAGGFIGAALFGLRERATRAPRSEVFAQLAEAMPFGVFVHEGGRLTYLNDALRQLLALDAGENAVGRSLLDFVHADDRDWVTGRVTQRLRGERLAGTVDVRLQRRDDRVVWARCSTSRVAACPRATVVGYVVDISPGKRAESGERAAKALLEGANDLIVIADGAGRVRSLNRVAQEALELPCTAEAEGRYLWELAPESQRPFVRWELLPAVQQTGDVKGEVEFIGPRSGRQCSFRYHAFRLPSDDGREDALFAMILTDVSDVRRAEEALRASESRFRLLTEQQHDTLATLTPNGVISYCSPAIRRLGGYDAEDVVGTHMVDYVSPPQRAEALSAVADLVRTRTSNAFRFDFDAADGRRIPVEISCRPVIEDGQVRSVQCALRDVTERQQRLEEQRATAERVKAQSRALQQFVTAWPDPAAEGPSQAMDLDRLLQSTLAALDGDRLSLWRRVPSANRNDEWRCDRFVDRGEPRPRAPEPPISTDTATLKRFRWPLRDERFYAYSDVNEQWAEPELARSLHIPDGSGSALMAGVRVRNEVVGFVLVSVEHVGRTWHPDEQSFISAVADQLSKLLLERERRELEDQLRHAQKMEAVGRLAGGVAHDFNNIVTTILGHCEYLLDDIRDDDPAQEDLLEIQTAAERATWLTGQLLSFSRRQTITPRCVDLGDSIIKAERMIARLIGEDIELSFPRTDDLWAVWADPGQLDQILLNLATNARDAMPRGGHLTVRTWNATISEDEARGCPEATAGEFVCLAVRDDGVGIAREHQRAIFEPFFSTKEDGKGTGLGLSTVYGIVRQNGGFITLDSALGEGSEFRVHLPRFDGPVAPETPENQESPQRGAGERVLLVEDEPAVRRLVQRELAEAGYRVLAAADGAAALALAEQADPTSFDLLVTDMVMPGMDGHTLARRLQTLHPALSVLYISGYPEEVVAEHGALSEPGRLLAKPFSGAQLLRRVRASLDARRAAPGTPE